MHTERGARSGLLEERSGSASLVWRITMADFVRVTLADGTEALFQTNEPDVTSLPGPSGEVAAPEQGAARFETVAAAAGQVCASIRERLDPDDLTLEIGVGLSADHGWYFAKSASNANLKVSLSWKRHEAPGAFRPL